MTRIKWGEPQNVPTNQPCPRCGAPARVYVTVRAGQGRVICPHCDYSDASRESQEPVRGVVRARGVQTLGTNVERVGGAPVKGVEILGN